MRSQKLELGYAIFALDRLVESSYAHTFLLHPHEERLKLNMSLLRQSETSFGAMCIIAISQIFFAVAQVSFFCI